MNNFFFFRFFKQKNLIIIFFILLIFFLALLAYTIFCRLPQLNQISVVENYVNKNNGVKQESILSWVLEIPKLDIKAPIILNVDGTDKNRYFKALQKGVAHMRGTALPGEGNTVIFGHSNFYEDDPGEYKTVFYNLNQLEFGDEIKILNKGKILRFLVSEMKTVEAENTEVIQERGRKELTLITCWPPGTIEQRLVVLASWE